MQRLPADSTYILLSRRSRLFRSIDYWPSVEVCFVAIRSLKKAKRMSRYRVSRSMTVAAWRKEKRRTIARTEAASCS